MNLIKGFNRVALAISLIALLPGFFVGGNICDKLFKEVTEEYKTWEIEYSVKKKFPWLKIELPSF